MKKIKKAMYNMYTYERVENKKISFTLRFFSPLKRHKH